MSILKYLLLGAGAIFVGLILAGLQRRFSSETLINGFMDYEKAKEVAPTIFPDKDKTNAQPH